MAADEKKQDVYDLFQDGKIYHIRNRWGNKSDYLGFTDNGKWLKVGYDSSQGVKWKVELDKNFQDNHQIYLWETWFNYGYVGYRDSDYAMRCSYQKNLRVPFEVVSVPEKGPRCFYLKQKWQAKKENWVGYRDNDKGDESNYVYCDYSEKYHVPFEFIPCSSTCVGIATYDDLLFEVTNGGSKAFKREEEYSVGVSDKTVNEFELDMSVGAKVSAGGSIFGIDISAEVSTNISETTKEALESSMTIEKKIKNTFEIPSKKRVVVTQKKVLIKMASGKSFDAASKQLSIQEFDI